MLKRALILLILALIQFGCGYEYGERFQIAPLSEQARSNLEKTKRELLRLEELTVGDGAVAAWGRKISIEMEVRYVDGTIVYRGPAWTYYGFKNMPETSVTDKKLIPFAQKGLRLGLNGMAVGGKRRITIDRNLVCTHLTENADPRAMCNLVGYADRNPVRKAEIIAEVTLIESCIPIGLAIFFWPLPAAIDLDIGCRKQESPRVDQSMPIWRLY